MSDFKLFNILTLVLWPNVRSVLENVPGALEKCVYSGGIFLFWFGFGGFFGGWLEWSVLYMLALVDL